MKLTKAQLDVKKRWRDTHGKTWKQENYTHVRTYDNKYQKAMRIKAVQKLGGKCSNPACQWLNADGSRGCTDPRCLQIDHVFGNGQEERRHNISGWALCKKVLLDQSGMYQLLCANCNWIKKFMNNENSRKNIFAQQQFEEYENSQTPPAPTPPAASNESGTLQ